MVANHKICSNTEASMNIYLKALNWYIIKICTLSSVQGLSLYADTSIQQSVTVIQCFSEAGC